jgi:hypothetical protein
MTSHVAATARVLPTLLRAGDGNAFALSAALDACTPSEMPMKRVMLVTALALAASTTLAAHQKSHGPHSKKAAKHESVANDAPRVDAHVHFSIGEQRVIREYYAPRYRSLPPGLQKKVARGRQLPPGWQKKLQPFPVEVERRLAPLPRDCGRGVIDGHAVIYSTRSHAVIDVAVLF